MPSRQNLVEVLIEDAFETPIQMVAVGSAEDAELLGMRGTPTIRIDGDMVGVSPYIGRDRFEFQMLYGIRRDLQQRLLELGYRAPGARAVRDRVVSLFHATPGRAPGERVVRAPQCDRRTIALTRGWPAEFISR
jgi:hypothetical protein